MNKKIFLYAIVAFLLLTSFVQKASGYAETGRQDEGSSLYVVGGSIAGFGASAILVSEIANGSEARFWEVALIIQVNDEDVGYWVQIVDSHQALDKNYPSSNVLAGIGKVVGTVVFGPFVVWANPEFGRLIWEINVLSTDGKENYINFIMEWGWGSGEPLKIDRSRDNEIGDNPLSGGYSFFHIIEAGGVIAFSVFTAHRKSKDHQIAESKYEVDMHE